MSIQLSPDGFTKIRHPLTKVYCGVIWKQDGLVYAEDRDVDVTDHDTIAGAINWLCRQATMTREAA